MVLVAFLAVPLFAGGLDGSRTGRQIAASSDRLALLGLFWLLPAAAVILALLGVRRTSAFLSGRIRAVGIVVVAGLAALGHVVALLVLQRPAGAAAAFAGGVDPASAVGPAYWLSLAGLVAAIVGGVLGMLSEPDESMISAGHPWPVVAGAAAGVALGTIIASVVVDVRHEAARRGIVLLAADTHGEAAFGPDFATQRAEAAAGAPTTTASVAGSEVAGDGENLYGGAFGRSSCDRDALAAFVAGASPARSDSWAHAMTSDPQRPRETDVRQYITELTPVHLRADTRVTSYRFIGDHALPFQAALQAGTAVLVDGHGIPRVRCAGATPLAPPRNTTDNPIYLAPRWPEFDPATLTTVTPSLGAIRQFGLTSDGRMFRRPAGTNGDRDVEMVPAQALIDGTYALSGKQRTCNLGNCEENLTTTLTITVTGCPARCLVAGGEWDGTLAMTASTADTWRASGTSTAPFNCGDTAEPTSSAVSLRVQAGRVIDGVWMAEQLTGTYSKTSTRIACTPGELSWDVSGTRR
jgi:hypothetical protein